GMEYTHSPLCSHPPGGPTNSRQRDSRDNHRAHRMPPVPPFMADIFYGAGSTLASCLNFGVHLKRKGSGLTASKRTCMAEQIEAAGERRRKYQREYQAADHRQS